ncbi:F-box domain protein [Onchocerca flexuosa]|uniref:F-box domain protein n=1 Tax=Onchocerca flexuosa TaxID=387005 RepID=A0A238BNX4_9BILA|nr:F-box domain protein [Onchocerca flexuosa]
MPSLKEFLENNVRRLQRRIGGETLISSLKKKQPSSSTHSEKCCNFTDEIWNTIFLECSPFDLYSWRRVSKNFKRIIDSRFNNILYLHADRRNIASILGNFYRHPRAQILLSLDIHSAIFIIHERWTPKDITKLFQAMQLLAPSIRNVSVNIGTFFSIP